MTVEDERINDENVSTAAVSAPRIFPGDLLRTAREAKGYTTQQVATHLCLRRQLIEEIEASKFDPKVAATFIRGYLKSYAKYVGVSEAEVLTAYDDLTLDKPKLDDMQSFSQKKAIEKQDSRLMLITYIIVAVLVASFVLFLWQQSGDDEQAVTTEQPVRTEPANAKTMASERQSVTQQQPIPQPEPKVAEQPIAPVEPNEQALLAEPTESNAAVLEASSAEPESTATAVEQQPAQPRMNTAVNRTGTFLEAADPLAGDLVLYFRDQSWVDVRDYADNDRVLAVGIKEKGYNMPLGGAEAYSVILGAPNAVEIYYQGQRVDLSELPRNRVVPFRVPTLQP
ncbi:RodZ domain-containing protein [Aliidiomarina quisquiliarum]|uniref:RodZ domain-containing protein n=1 Tax=Aliidiomarina quisquiliarum TaxID=2938947 RepID=UPI00208FB16B|nr:RodZ domain-containing protein [Aliidiomarina quisquiliarum]MCO4321565.1 DUF4115 domain-containing protein [Aliidiomarina quisquiliarum]